MVGHGFDKIANIFSSVLDVRKERINPHQPWDKSRLLLVFKPIATAICHWISDVTLKMIMSCWFCRWMYLREAGRGKEEKKLSKNKKQRRTDTNARCFIKIPRTQNCKSSMTNMGEYYYWCGVVVWQLPGGIFLPIITSSVIETVI